VIGVRRALVLLAIAAGCNEQPAPRKTPPSPAKAEPKPDPTIGPWGETNALAPDFCLPQERRCPKVPAGDKLWKNLATPIEMERLENGLLICYAEVTREVQWDGLFGPDLLFEFRVGKQTPISLWGPEDHWRMYVSVPRLTLNKGDVIGVHAWDRDVRSNTEIGFVVVTFDGKFPLEFVYKKDGIDYLRMDCRAMTEPEAVKGATPRLGSLDRALDRISIEPDETLLGWGVAQAETAFEGVKGNYFDGNFRYPAGFLGWEHPIIQQRLVRLKTMETTWAQNKAAKLREVEAAATVRGTWAHLGKKGEARVGLVQCEPAGAPCRVQLETRDLPEHDPAADNSQKLAGFDVGAIDEQAKFHAFQAIEPGNQPGQYVLVLTGPARLLYFSKEAMTYLRL
jgi:hypothetical protein